MASLGQDLWVQLKKKKKRQIGKKGMKKQFKNKDKFENVFEKKKEHFQICSYF